jgi:ATP-binding cassette subfamily F protein 3
MESFIERFRAKATKARQAQSRVKRLDKIERITRDPRDGRELGIAFKAPERSGRVIFELEHGHLEVPGRVLIDDADLWLERGEHVTLVGPNGTGKTTLINALAGRRPLDGGRLKSGHNVKVGYLSQHGEELEFGGARTVLEACQHHTKQPPNQARALLGRFLFSGDEAEKPLEGLSGGERKRLGLAILVASGANVLILDEPTNHLDLESREALEDALQAFPGALLLVSHDRALLEAIGTRTVAVEDYNLRSYVGGWQEYWAAREERKASGQLPPPPPEPRGMADPSGRLPGEERTADGMAVQRSGAREEARPNGSGARNGAGAARASAARGNGGRAPAAGGGKAGDGAGAGAKGASKNRSREQARLEKAVEDAETALSALEDELADPSHWATQYATAKATARHTAAQRAVDAAYAALEAFEARAPV